MKRLLVFAALISIFTTHSCSKSVESVDYLDLELESFVAWMEAYEPDATPFTDSLTGYYKAYPAGLSDEKVEEGDWVNITFTGKTLDGQYFKNFYKSLAYWLGTYKKTAHYIPMFAQIDSTNFYYITQGMYRALLKMSPGDSVSLFLSSEMAYGASGTSPVADGFNGDKSSISAYTPVHIGMRLDSIIRNPLAHEQMLVEEYARNVLKMATYDSIADGLYLKFTKNNPDGDTISDDSTVYIRYTGYFLDGFIFDTNYESIADSLDIDTFSEDLYELDCDGTSTIDAWLEAIVDNMRKGEKATILTTSSWAYGYYGSMGDTTTIIYPYTPLVFDVWVLTDDEYDDETD